MAVVSVAEVKTHLKIATEDRTGQLQSFLDAAVAAIEERVGPLEPRERTVRVRPAVGAIRLPTPAVSIASLMDADGAAVEFADDLYLDGPAGLLTTNVGICLHSHHYTVTYVAGRDPVPVDLKLAVLELVRHFWETQRGPTRRPGSSTSEATSNTVPGAAYLLPFRVSELIKPHMPILVGI